MFQDVKTVYVKLDDSLVYGVGVQTRFPKTNKKRIMKKWYKRFNKTLFHPKDGFHMVGADFANNAIYVTVHPAYFKSKQETFETYNNNPELPNMVLVCE